jgi:2-oxoglutarate ferredoxin oxidoreductase subunit beta
MGENGITRDDILVHDATEPDPSLHMSLINMAYPDFPVAMGVIRNVEAPVYDQEMKKQIEKVQATRKITCMDELLNSGNTWVVDGPNCSEPVSFFDKKCFVSE